VGNNALPLVLAVIAGWLAIGVLGLVRPRHLWWIRNVLFPAGAAIGVLLAAVALTAIGPLPQSTVLPLGLPDLPFHLRLDSLSAFFLLLLGAASAGISFYASGYFDELCEFAEKLLKKGKAFVCDLSAEEFKEYRGTITQPGKNSPSRDRTPDENLDLFRRMRAGEYPDGSKTLRAKIDMAHPNMLMRDPALYRIRRATHYRTGDKWCVYPMYDWAHGQSDSIEGVTHSICTLEFEVHRPLYDWCLENLEIHHSRQIEFARLNLSHTVLSKRKLLELVKEGRVGGWNDPRMPTLSGLRRRGYTPEAIRNFCETIGVAKADSIVDLPLLENYLREDLNKRVPRVMAVLRPLKVVLTNYPEGRVEQLEAEREALVQRYKQVEQENLDFANRYLEIEAENNNLANLYVASFQLHSTLDFKEVVQIVMEIVINLIGAEKFGLLLIDDRKGDLYAVSSEGVERERIPHVKLGEGTIGKAVQGGQPWVAEGRTPDQITMTEPQVVIPMRIKDQFIGAIVIYSLLEQKPSFSSLDHELFNLLAGHAATALFASKLYSESERKLSTIQGFLDLLKQ
jgi:glutamyl/glutaminyl-tRNA synthetase